MMNRDITELRHFREHVLEKGYGEKISIDVLEKIEPGGKAAILKQTIETLCIRFQFLTIVEEVLDLFRDITEIKFNLNKQTGYYNYEKIIENKYRHVCDTVVHYA